MCPPSEEGHDEAASDSDETDGPEPGPLVVVVDSSTIIAIKWQVPLAQQWDEVFAPMRALVEKGRLAFPSQVAKEVARERHPDTPGTWCGAAAKVVQHPDPSEGTLTTIGPEIQDLVEVDAEPDREPADPYIVAMAFELLEAGYDVAVATEDQIDRLPVKVALTTACERLGIAWWDLETFLGWVAGRTEETP